MRNILPVILIWFYLLNMYQGFYIKPMDYTDITLKNFAFGSCFYGRQSTRLDIFKSIKKTDAQMWFWLGDAAYVDKKLFLKYYKSTIDLNFTDVENIFDKARNNECTKIL